MPVRELDKNLTAAEALLMTDAGYEGLV
jgi:hypothetical protein